MNVPWYPEEMSAPLELTSCRVPKGRINQKEWVQALSDRVTDLAKKEPKPLRSANLACQKLDLPQVENVNQLGDALVKYNLNLITNLNVSQEKDQFPAQVKPNPLAAKALNETNLESWVELALSQVSVSSLD